MKAKLFSAVTVFALMFAGVVILHPSVSFSEEDAMNDAAAVENADDSADMAEAVDMAEGDAMEAIEAVEAGNTICPVDGHAIADGEGYKVEYKGTIYSLCSAACEAPFLTDADALISKLDAEVAPDVEIVQP